MKEQCWYFKYGLCQPHKRQCESCREHLEAEVQDAADVAELESGREAEVSK